MKKAILLFSIFTMFFANAQTVPTIQWQKSLGGSDDDYANSIQQTTDGGYIVAGYSYSNDGDVIGHHGSTNYADYWIVKLDSNGEIQWQKSYGGSNDDIAYSVQQTTDGGYIVAGESYSNDGDVTGHHGSTINSDYWVVKLDNNGTMQWQKSLGGSSSDSASSIQQTADGGYVVAGASYNTMPNQYNGQDYLVVKLDDNGTIQWQKYYGGVHRDYANSVHQTTDNGYIVAGYSFSNGNVSGHHGSTRKSDYWVVKLNDSGTLEWENSFGGDEDDIANSIQQTIDGGYIVAGRSYSNNGDVTGNHGVNDSWIVKLNSGGAIEFQKALGGGGGDSGYSIQQTADRGYIVAGSSASNSGDVSGNHGSSDYWIVKLNNSGSIQWQKSLGGSGSDIAKSIQKTADGGYIVAGYSRSNNGDVTGNHGYADFWVVKLSEDILATQEMQNTKINIYPNPVKDIINFSEEVSNVRITDIAGRTVKEFPAKGKSVNIANLAKGNYIVTAVAKSGETVTKKIVKE